MQEHEWVYAICWEIFHWSLSIANNFQVLVFDISMDNFDYMHLIEIFSYLWFYV